MSGINRIKLPKYPLQEEKLNFFVDYFNYYLEFSGVIANIELDNPLSYVEKILFQLEHNHLNSKCINYIRNHSTKLLAYPKGYTKEFSAYRAVRTAFRKWIVAGGKYPYITSGRQNLIQLLTALQQQLQKKMFESSIDQIIMQISCTHPPEEHTQAISFHTQIIASELIFRRRRKEEVRQLFYEIMTKDYKQFPYPSHIISDIEKKNFFKKKGTKETLKAIQYYYEKPAQSWQIFFIVEGMTLYKKYVFQYGNCKLYSPNNYKLRKLKSTIIQSQDSLVNGLLNNHDIALCEVTVNSVMESTAYWEAVFQAKRTVNYINRRLGRSFSLIQGNYFFSANRKNYGYKLRDLGRIKMLNEYEIELIEDNAYQFFVGKNKYVAQAGFLQYEDRYIDGRDTENTSELWQYLEVLLKDSNSDKHVKATVSGAILMHEKNYRTNRIENYLKNAISFINSSANDLGISYEEQQLFFQGKIKLKALMNKIKSVFFKKAYKEMAAPLTQKQLSAIRRFYYSILEEAYELRNFDIHMGYGYQRAIIKLSYTFPALVNRMRWVLFDYMQKHPTLTLMGILTQLKSDIDKKYGKYIP